MASWGYTKENGPCWWHKWFPIADTGNKQSPIDLNTKKVSYDSKLEPLLGSYPKIANASFLNNGHSVQFQPAAGENASELSGGPLKHKYKFEQFHFHWGSKDTEGSEHRVDGIMYPAELHLVHWNSGLYGSFKEAVASGDANALCVLGFFLKVGAGKDHVGLKPVTDLLPKVKKAGESVAVPGEFDLKPILPAALTEYWTYDGSLTTPPLAELVKWIVFKDPLEISHAQMEGFRAVQDRHMEPMSGNYRPPCPLHTRSVTASFSV